MEETKKKRGRPLKTDARRKSIFSKCNDEEYSTIERAARLNGMTISEFIRISTYKASVDSISKRQETLKELYGSANDEYEEKYIEEDGYDYYDYM